MLIGSVKIQPEKAIESIKSFYWQAVVLLMIAVFMSQANSEIFKITVENPNSVDCEKPVEVKVPEYLDNLIIVDEEGQIIDSQIDDVDGDSIGDVLIFLPKINAGKIKEFYLVPGNNVLSKIENQAFKIENGQMGSWIPIHIPPTIGQSELQMVPNVSLFNKRKTLELKKYLETKKDVIRVVFPIGTIVLSKSNGLIEAMRPNSILMGGSYLREYSHDLFRGHGELKILNKGPVFIRLRYDGNRISREISIYRNGLIETKNQVVELLQNFQIITSCYSYPFSSCPTNPEGIRFSRMIEREFEIPNSSCLYLYNPQKMGLGIEMLGLSPCKEKIWADGGELAYEVGLQLIKQKGVKSYLEQMGELCEPYIGGMIRLEDFKLQNKKFSIGYEIINSGVNSAAFFDSRKPFVTKLQRVKTAPSIASVLAPEKKLSCELTVISNRVTRLYPNKGNGWKLRPYVLAMNNPLPAYYDINFSNRTNEPINIKLSISKESWISGVSLSEINGKRPYILGTIDVRGPEIPFVKEERDLASSLTITAGETKKYALRLALVEQTLGEYGTNLHVQWGNQIQKFDLPVVVVPNTPSFTMPNDDTLHDFWIVREFGFTASYGWLTTSYMQENGSIKPYAIEDRVNICRDMERHGLFYIPDIALRGSGYLRYRHERKMGQKIPIADMEQLSALSPEEFAPLLEIYAREIRQALPGNAIAYWGHDEIWELLGSGKCKIDEIKALDESLIRGISPHPLFNTIMAPGIDAGLHKILPTDIPMSFYYSGRDRKFQEYASSLRNGYLDVYNSWKKNKQLLKQSETKNPQPLLWFFISGMQHVSDYNSMRRQAWWLLNNGYSGINCWTLFAGCSSSVLYANGAGCFTVMMTDRKNGFILTDRAFAMIDISSDISLLTELAIRKEKIVDIKINNEIAKLESGAYCLSQLNRFDDAVAAIERAIALCKGITSPSKALIPQSTSLPQEKLKQEDLMVPGVQRMIIPSVGKFRPAPNIDGKLDNSLLEDGCKINSFVKNTGNELPSQQTQVYLLYDDKNIYIFFECFESEIKNLKALSKCRDENIWEDDCVELFLSPTMDGQYFHMAVNSKGTKYDQKMPCDAPWNPEWDAKTMVQPGSWTVEIAIPFSSLGLKKPKVGDKWRFNLCRERPKGPEISCWSPAQSFHDFARFGVAVFGE